MKLWEGMLCGLVALALYLALAQDVFYKTDGTYLVYDYAKGNLAHPYNPLYLPLLSLFGVLVAPLGLTHYWTAVAFSACSTAAGVGLAHVAFRRAGMSGPPAWLATALVLACPPVFFFATIVEHHAPFFPFAALCFVATVELARKPGVLLALLLGCLTHLAYAVHGTGNLLPALVLPWFLATRWRQSPHTWKRDLALGTVAGVVHLLLFFFLLDIEVPLGREWLETFKEGIGRPRHIKHLPAVTWQEWLHPYLPLSLTCLVALFCARLRLEGIAFLVGLAPYLVLVLLAIVGEAEFGAYLLPLAIPAARLTVLALRPWQSGAMVAISLALAVAAVWQHNDRTDYLSFADGLRSVTADRPYVLLYGGTEELNFCLRELPDAPLSRPEDTVHGVEPEDYPELFKNVDDFLRTTWARGTDVLLTDGAYERLKKPELPAGRPLLEHLHDTYRLERIQSGRFRAWRIGPR